MARRTRKTNMLTEWTETPAAREKYNVARADAQERANRTGYDYGIERNDLFKSFHVFILPQRKNRYGHELQCEVVSCEKLDHCQVGHGPRA